MHRVEVDDLHRDRAAGHSIQLANDPLRRLRKGIADKERLDLPAVERTRPGSPNRGRNGGDHARRKARLEQLPARQPHSCQLVLVHFRLLNLYS